MAIENVIVPDVGGATDVEVIEILVKTGDKVAVDDGLVTLESDKASMDVPSSVAGVIKEIKVKVGNKINEGDIVVTIETEAATETETEDASTATTEKSESSASHSVAAVQDVIVPDVGGATNVEVIEVLVKPGDKVTVDQGLVTLESDKASMDVPSTIAGIVKAVKVKLGDKINEGDAVVAIETPASISAKAAQSAETQSVAVTKTTNTSSAPAKLVTQSSEVYAGPGVRRIAQEFGVNLSQVKGTGRKGRIVKEDVQAFVKNALQNKSGASGAGLDLLPWPKVDFKKFGDVEVKELNKIKRATARNLHRNWVMIPHVTQFDDADITEMEAFRQANKDQVAKLGFKLTPIVFIMKAVVSALKEYPVFNSSLDETGEHLILKKYFNIGIAVDTPNGLVVPVIKDVDRKNLRELAKELAEISDKARDGKLGVSDMQGGNFAISSLGGIGGTAFTPIVNAPDVAILGVSKSQMKPVYQHGKFVPRLMLPLSLSYDHRVIDGADGARFITYLAKCLSDVANLVL